MTESRQLDTNYITTVNASNQVALTLHALYVERHERTHARRTHTLLLYACVLRFMGSNNLTSFTAHFPNLQTLYAMSSPSECVCSHERLKADTLLSLSLDPLDGSDLTSNFLTEVSESIYNLTKLKKLYVALASQASCLRCALLTIVCFLVCGAREQVAGRQHDQDVRVRAPNPERRDAIRAPSAC